MKLGLGHGFLCFVLLGYLFGGFLGAGWDFLLFSALLGTSYGLVSGTDWLGGMGVVWCGLLRWFCA